MDFFEIFKESLKFPIKDFKWLLLGVFLVLANIGYVLVQLGIGNNGIVATISLIIVVIFSLIVYGYLFSIVKTTINKSDEFPEFNILNNFVDGIKIIIVTIVYNIIPAIISCFLLAIPFAEILATNSKTLLALNSSANNPAVITELVNKILTPEVAATFLIVVIISLILFIIFTLLETVAVARLADKGNFGSAFAIKEVWRTISQIGWGRYIAWYILMIIISFIIMIIFGIVGLMPYFGLIIAYLIIFSFMAIFNARSLGLIYNEKDN
ncbi:MAG: DUF4013 domain-containing protein [Methanobrevibacter sp.]|jgi:hypothetical protein|nr:DUF4013 domain-containing protein [Methanobrevibacter sp.]